MPGFWFRRLSNSRSSGFSQAPTDAIRFKPWGQRLYILLPWAGCRNFRQWVQVALVTVVTLVGLVSQHQLAGLGAQQTGTISWICRTCFMVPQMELTLVDLGMQTRLSRPGRPRKIRMT